VPVVSAHCRSLLAKTSLVFVTFHNNFHTLKLHRLSDITGNSEKGAAFVLLIGLLVGFDAREQSGIRQAHLGHVKTTLSSTRRPDAVSSTVCLTANMMKLDHCADTVRQKCTDTRILCQRA